MRRTTWLMALSSACLAALAVAGLTAFPRANDPVTEEPVSRDTGRQETPKQDGVGPKGKPITKVAVGRNVFVEVENKKAVRVVVEAHVCLRQGWLEHLLTCKGRKAHEAILTADIDARDLHAALLTVGAAPGGTVVFEPVERPPWGSTIKISLVYKKKEGGEVRVSARQWVRHRQTKADLHTDWVFAGSRFIVHDAAAGKADYLANIGDVICVANFETALLDLPILSSEHDNEYEAHTDRIPPKDTPVQVILEPVRGKKK